MALVAESGIDGIDVIGDVHGSADMLEGLLRQMGYNERGGAWRHDHRRAVFVGDLVDRGRLQVRSVEIARAMVDTGAAHIVVGNHEFNAIAFATADPDSPGEFLRPRSDKNVGQHKEFVEQVGLGTAQHRSIIDWFGSLPLWLEIGLDGATLRVVHACWHEPSMAALEPLLDDDHSLTTEGVIAASRKGSEAYDAVEAVLKGPEVDLGGLAYVDKGNITRDRARIGWWRRGATTLREIAEIPGDARQADGSAFPELPDTVVADPITYDDEVPVVFGHYWRTGELRVAGPTAACVDYSVAKGGPLVAYRWNGERELTDAGYVAYGR
jgi:hypothetical protein